MSIASLLLYCVYVHGALASASLSISPSESLSILDQATPYIQQVTVQRADASVEQVYDVAVEIEPTLSGVSVAAESFVFEQGETAYEYAYTVLCNQECAGSGNIIVRFTPELPQGEGIVTQIGIAHVLRLAAAADVAPLDAEPADSAPTIEDAQELPANIDTQNQFNVQDVVLKERFMVPGEQVIARIFLSSSALDAASADVRIPYSIIVLRDNQQMSRERGVWTQANLTPVDPERYVVKWSTELGTSGTYRIIYTIDDTEHEFIVYVSFVQPMLFGVTLFAVLSMVLWYVVRFMYSAVLRASKTDVRTADIGQQETLALHTHQLFKRRLKMYALCVLCCIGVGVGIYMIIRLPIALPDSKWSYTSLDTPAFLLVHDADQYRIARLSDAKMDSLTGAWNFFITADNHFYAAPAQAAPLAQESVQAPAKSTDQYQFFYRIFEHGIERYSTSAFEQPITLITENTPGTYAIASSTSFVCIFKTGNRYVSPGSTEADALAQSPDCHDLSAIDVDPREVQSAHWIEERGQYVELCFVDSSGEQKEPVYYDAWNKQLVDKTIAAAGAQTPGCASSSASLTAAAVTELSPIQWSALETPHKPEPLLTRFITSVFGVITRTPWSARFVELETAPQSFLGLLSYPSASDTFFLALMSTPEAYTPFMEVSQEAEVFYLRKGTVITIPVISDR